MDHGELEQLRQINKSLRDTIEKQASLIKKQGKLLDKKDEKLREIQHEMDQIAEYNTKLERKNYKLEEKNILYSDFLIYVQRYTYIASKFEGDDIIVKCNVKATLEEVFKWDDNWEKVYQRHKQNCEASGEPIETEDSIIMPTEIESPDTEDDLILLKILIRIMECHVK